MELNTALIQEQIATLNISIGYLQPARTPELKEASEILTRRRNQWLEILSAVEQHGKQEPVAWVYTDLVTLDFNEAMRWVKADGLSEDDLTALTYTSPVQPAAPKPEAI